jgi:hypothetical protein
MSKRNSDFRVVPEQATSLEGLVHALSSLLDRSLGETHMSYSALYKSSIHQHPTFLTLQSHLPFNHNSTIPRTSPLIPSQDVPPRA